MSDNKNCKNVDNCNSCYSCYSCYFCDSCNSCYSCYSCYFCYSCNSCNSCDSCYSCYSCYFCDSCYSCNSCNSCDSCYGLRMSERMIFCLGDGRYQSEGEGFQKNNRIFNKDVSSDVFDKHYGSRPAFKLPVAMWVDKKDMTDGEKEKWTSYAQTGGFLKTLSYKDAWKEGWKTASDDFKKWVKELPNFDAKLFEEITGIAWNEGLIGQTATVEIGGKKYKAIIQSEE